VNFLSNSEQFKTLDLGRLGYGDALKIQEEQFKAILDVKRQGVHHELSTLIFVEHNPVYTLGKSGDESNIKQNPETVGAEFYKTSRGGDITYHGPGQIVGYPIFDLEKFNIGVREYIWNIEQAIINVIDQFGLKGDRISDASGVWLDSDTDAARKICAIGVKASRYVTMHGFAFNINTDLGYFDHIIPCGIEDKGVTSLEKELSAKQDIEAVKNLVRTAFNEVFRISK
jgi:lipoyl(octanoyl) transferase